jgi:hypothetical protein
VRLEEPTPCCRHADTITRDWLRVPFLDSSAMQWVWLLSLHVDDGEVVGMEGCPDGEEQPFVSWSRELKFSFIQSHETLGTSDSHLKGRWGKS